MSPLAVWLTTFGVCVVSAMIPVVNAEIYLLSASALAPRSLVVPLILAATLGQMVGKVVMYYAARGAVKLPWRWMERGIGAVEARFRNREGLGGLVLFSSATAGFPPFYAVTVAWGLLRMRLAHFLVVGFIGRLLRFTVVVLLPQLAKNSLPM